MSHPFQHVVTDGSELRQLVGEPNEVVIKKQLSRLDAHCRSFIAASPFALLATSDGAGRCDVSPKGDTPGFVLVLDESHLAVPDRPGNRRIDGMRNIIENPHVGLIFLIPGREETLRVNGRAWIVRDADLLARMEVQGKRPQLAIGVEVEECFLHCAKAFKRSKLWQPGEWPDTSRVASMAQMLLDHTGEPGQTVEGVQRRLEEGYRTRLY